MPIGAINLSPPCLPIEHPTALVFLDETGVVHRRERYFGIGVLKLSDPAVLLRGVQSLRDRYEFREELHWASFDKGRARAEGSQQRLAFAKRVMDLFFECYGAHFCAYIADRQHGDLTAKFRGHPHAAERAYGELASRVLRDATDDEEVVSVIADRRDTSAEVDFERDLAKSINTAKGRLAVATVCRMDSRSIDALQVVDLLLGAATLDLRQGRTGSGREKQRLLEHLLEHCKCSTFRPRGQEDRGGRWKVKLLSRSPKTRRKRGG